MSPRKTVWHIGYADVIAIGRLFATGRLPLERVVALGGPGVVDPRLLRTRWGASLEDLLDGELREDAGPLRVVSGCVLHGDHAAGPGAYLGRYHNQISVLREGVRRGARRTRWSAAGLFSRRPGGARRRPLTTARNGRPTAMVPVDAHERVLPMDIVAAPLLRALLVGDAERAEALGCLELSEEDLAVLTFVCPAKADYGPHLRAALDTLARPQ